jgi:hypothetical protein
MRANHEGSEAAEDTETPPGAAERPLGVDRSPRRSRGSAAAKPEGERAL